MTRKTFRTKLFELRATFFLIGMIYLLLSGDIPIAWPIAKMPPRDPIVHPSRESIVLPLSIQDCYHLALKRSETIAIRKEEIEETEAEFLKATGEVLGDVDFLITDFRQDNAGSGSGGGSSVGNTLTSQHRRERKFVMSQPLFQGFRSIAALGAAGSLRKQRKEERIRAEHLLFLDVASSFYDVLKQKKNVEIIEGIHQSFRERIIELEEREKIGRSRTSEVVTAVSRMKIIESELAHARGTLAISLHVLEFLIGIPVNLNRLTDQNFILKIEPELARSLEMVETRPDVEAAKQAMKTAWRGVVEAQSNLWPEISLDSNVYQKREGFQKDIDWDVLLKINIPLSRGGEHIGILKQAVSQWKKVKLNYSLTKRQAELDIKEAYQNWRSSLEEHKALEEATKASQKNFELQKEEYSRSLVSNLDVLEALEEFYTTRRQANQIHYDVKENYWRFKVAEGNLNESI